MFFGDQSGVRPVTLYHVTTTENAEAILRNGFAEREAFFGASAMRIGVWLSGRPLNPAEGASGDAILAVAFNVEPRELSFYELVDDGKSFRQWCLPASLIRAHGKVSIVPTDTGQRFWCLTDIEYLERLFASTHKTNAAITASISAVKASETLLVRIERQLNGGFGEELAAAAFAVSLDSLLRSAIGRTKGKARAAIYMADADGRQLRHIVGMSKAYARYVDGFTISPESLACGLAAATGQAIITADVMAEPRWKPWLWLAERFGYRACWSFPIQTATGKIVGTFAMYYREPTEATPDDLDLASTVTRAAAAILSSPH